MIGTEQ